MKPLLKRLESRGRDAAACALGLALRPRRGTPELIRQGFESGRIKKILLVRPYQGLGDLFCATPVISNLKADFPGLAIHFLANTFNQAAVRGSPGLDKIWAWDERAVRNPLSWLRLRRDLREENYDLALILSGNALSLTSILLAHLSGARLIAGLSTQAYGRNWGRWLYSCEIPHRNPVKEMDKFLGLLEGLGLACPIREPVYWVAPEHAAFAQNRLREIFPQGARPLLGVFIGGKVDRPERIWPPSYYAEAARRILAQKPCDLIVIAPPGSGRLRHQRETTFWKDEDVHLAGFRKAFAADFPVFQDADLGRVAAVVSRLDLLICPDGGLMHLAAALKVPTLALYFGTDPEIWNPPVPTAHFLRGPGPDPKSLEPVAVAEAALQLLSPERK